MKLLIRTLILQIILLSSNLVAADNSDTPSIKHCNKYTDRQLSSVAEELANELGRRINASVAHVNAPIRRCIKMLKASEVDFMLAVKMTDLRADFFDFVIPSNSQTQEVLLTLKSDGDWLNNYEDLKGKSVGAVSGHKHFQKLEADSGINKLRVMSWEQLPKILLGGRVDSIITYEGVAKTMMLKHPNIVKAPYFIDHIKLSLIAVSKRSKLHHRLDELTLIGQGMLDDGYVDTIMEKYMPGLSLPFSKSPILN